MKSENEVREQLKQANAFLISIEKLDSFNYIEGRWGNQKRYIEALEWVLDGE